jgi:hypothetical protein
MKLRPFTIATLLALSVLLAVIAHAQSLRCNGRLIHLGATTADVVAVCGEPVTIDRWKAAEDAYVQQHFDYAEERFKAPRLIQGPIAYERWVYDFGPHRFTQHLIFQNDELIKIEDGPRGG